jgi:hypothetical protein
MKKDDWIRVEDLLPEDGDCVLMLSRYRTHNGSERSIIEEHVFLSDLGFKVHESKSLQERITHWMPIELPDEYEDIY